MTFALHDALDIAALREAFARDRAVRIAPFLSDAAAAMLEAHLLARGDWKQHINMGPKLYELSRADRAGFTAERRAALDAAVAAQAAAGFQFRFEALRVPDHAAERARDPSPLARFGDFMNSGAVLGLLRDVTGASIDFADAQGTLYGPGDFLTEHDDAVAGKNRRAAYVMNLTRAWKPDWGGLLLFPDDSVAWAPAWNSLSLFAVPRRHLVSLVAPFAGASRLSVTGWLRAR